MTMPTLQRTGARYESSYVAKVFPYFFYNERGTLGIEFSDEQLARLEKGERVEFKGEARKLWGDITDSDLEHTKGNIQAIGGLLRQKYGHAKDDFEGKFDGLVKRFGHEASTSTDEVKKSVADSVGNKN